MVSFCLLCFKFLKLSKMYKVILVVMVMYYNVIGSEFLKGEQVSQISVIIYFTGYKKVTWFLNRRFSLHDLLSSVEARKEEYFVT